MSTGERVNYIDLLKFIGLTGIIIAHVGSPSWLMMLRSFDVPLMVILSAVLADKSYKKYEGQGITGVKQYCMSRFKRLVFPTWLFLTLYFATMILATGHVKSIEYYVASFCLTRYGIGYVWVILVYLYCAFLIPVFVKMQFSAKNAIIIAAVYIAYEIGFAFISSDGIAYKILETTIFNIIPYGCISYLGFHYYKMSKKIKFTITGSALLLFIITGLCYRYSEGSFQLVSIAKYPPRLYYLSYGVFCSFALLMICENTIIKNLKSRLICWISTHSMWIYLWHILVLTVYDVFNLPDIWYVKLIIVYALSMLAVWIVNVVLDLIERKKSIGFLSVLRG